ncbi:MAG: insulinase family protein, partial [Roseiflexus sp.]|nr:insulinase family protein [Roseiflexus sp.]
MFQGSANVKKAEHMAYIQKAGGTFNASTSWDRTNYFQVVPSLIAHFNTHPAVTNIDIGVLDPPEAGVIGVRIHVRGKPDDLSVPAEIDGIPVGIVRGDYRLQ